MRLGLTETALTQNSGQSIFQKRECPCGKKKSKWMRNLMNEVLFTELGTPEARTVRLPDLG